MAEKDQQPHRDELAESLNDLFNAMSTMITSELQVFVSLL